jgi:hypothetical protein
MWRLNACERLMEPEPRTLKRLAAPLLVFIFGMADYLSLLTAAGGETNSHLKPEDGLFVFFVVINVNHNRETLPYSNTYNVL